MRTIQETNPVPINYPVYVMFGFFILTNLTTAIFLILYYLQNKNKVPRDVIEEDE